MHKLLALSAIALGCVAILPAARSQENDYLCLPVTTELQRRELVGPDISVYAAINGAALVRGSTIDTKNFDLAAFRRELSGLAKQRPGGVKIYLLNATGQAERSAVDFSIDALAQIGRRAGFETAQTGMVGHNSQWTWREELNSIPAAVEGQPEGEEAALGDQHVRVYPVRTRLSRWLTSNADAVVVVRQPFDGRTPGLPEKTVESIRQWVGKLAITNKRKLLICLDSTAAGRPFLDRFVEVGAKELASSLGFSSSSVRNSPNSGAPESMLGKPAPDFTLRGLDGKELNLHEAIQGKVALLTFWGVACGPCRQEAPHLSTLHRQFKGTGFTVIAVNAYDETQEKVAKYVEQAQLTHPIGLMGKQVAHEKYAVGAYPTSYWIDHRGKVVDYVVGFDPGDEALLAAQIRKLLNERGEP